MDFWQGIITLLDKYGVQTVIVLILLILLMRTVPGFLSAISDYIRTRANASATKQTGEVQNDAKVLDILQQQVNNTTTTNNILLQYQAEFIQTREAVNRANQTNERIEGTLKEFNAETKALRLDLKNWPDTLDGTVAGLVVAVDTMRVRFEASEATDADKNVRIIELLEDVHTKVGVIYQLAISPPPPPPATAPEPSNITHLTDADGAKHPPSDTLSQAS